MLNVQLAERKRREVVSVVVGAKLPVADGAAQGQLRWVGVLAKDALMATTLTDVHNSSTKPMKDWGGGSERNPPPIQKRLPSLFSLYTTIITIEAESCGASEVSTEAMWPPTHSHTPQRAEESK